MKIEKKTEILVKLAFLLAAIASLLYGCYEAFKYGDLITGIFWMVFALCLKPDPIKQ